MELRNYGDEVFQADYLQKKRSRRGKVEFLVKWKGYSTKQSTWEPADNILDPLLIAEFESKREELRKKQRLLRKKRKQRLASAEQLSDANDSEQDDVLPFRPSKRRGPSQENLWPYLPSDRLPLLWGSPPRAPKPRKARQKAENELKRKMEDEEEEEEEEENERFGKSSHGLSVIYEKGNKRRKSEKMAEAGDEDEDDEDDDDDMDDDENDEDEDEEEDEKWSTECWEVKYSPTLSSSPGEGNVLRVHRVRSDVDYVERELSPLSDTASGLKGVKSTYNNNNDNNNSNIVNNNNNVEVATDSKENEHCPRNPTNAPHRHNCLFRQWETPITRESSSTPSHTSHSSFPKPYTLSPPSSQSLSTVISSTKESPSSHSCPNPKPRIPSLDTLSTQPPTTTATTNCAITPSSNTNAKTTENAEKEDEDDWNFSSQFESQVMKERERLEAQILKESNDLVDNVNLADRKAAIQCHVEDAKSSSSSLWSHPRSYSYSNSDQYQHKKLHHARRRHTLDMSRDGHRITVTNVKCHQVKVTFVESDSDQGFFKHSATVRTG